MTKDERITSLEQLLERLGEASDHRDRVAVSTMLGVVGRKSFGPLLLLAGMIAFSPLSGVPGVPTFVALIVVLTAGQLLFGRTHFWLPGWIVRRTVPRDKFTRALKMMRAPARFVDRFFRPRLVVLTQMAGVYVIAMLCVLIALTMPPMELVPFAATTAGAALAAFGLALIAHDGLMTVVAMVFCAGILTFVVRSAF